MQLVSNFLKYLIILKPGSVKSVILSDVLDNADGVGEDLPAAVLLDLTLQFGSFLFSPDVPEVYLSLFVLCTNVFIKSQMVRSQLTKKACFLLFFSLPLLWRIRAKSRLTLAALTVLSFLYRLPLPAQKAAKDKLVSGLHVRAICRHKHFQQGTLKSSPKACRYLEFFITLPLSELSVYAIPQKTPATARSTPPADLHAIKTLKQKHKEVSESVLSTGSESVLGTGSESALSTGSEKVYR